MCKKMKTVGNGEKSQKKGKEIKIILHEKCRIHKKHGRLRK